MESGCGTLLTALVTNLGASAIGGTPDIIGRLIETTKGSSSTNGNLDLVCSYAKKSAAALVAL
jgi:hypothetical protein